MQVEPLEEGEEGATPRDAEAEADSKAEAADAMQDAEAPPARKSPSSSSSSSNDSSSDSSSSSSAGAGGGPATPQLDDVAQHVNAYGFAAASADEWRVKPAEGDGPEVQLTLLDSQETDGHMHYMISCTLQAPGRQPLEWMISQRLSDLKRGILTHVVSELGHDYKDHFKGDFCDKKSIRNSKALLANWMKDLSALLNSGGCAPRLTGTVLKALEAPEATPAEADASGTGAAMLGEEAGTTQSNLEEADGPGDDCGSKFVKPPDAPAREEPSEGAGEKVGGLSEEQEEFLGRCMRAWVVLLEDSLALEGDGGELLGRVRPHLPTAPEMQQCVCEPKAVDGAPEADAEEVD